MSISHIPYRDTGYFSTLICDLVEQHPALEAMIARNPSIASFGVQLKEKADQYTKTTRTALVKALKEQYANLPMSEEVLANISLLEDKKTFTITTGHQLNLFTGPLYFVFKIVSTINLCKQLKEKYPSNDFVPIYWMATEDHDFEEISFFNFNEKKIKWTSESKGAVGRLPLDSLAPLLDLFEGSIGANRAASLLKALIKTSYRSSANLAEATLRLVHELFSSKGLVILDADTPDLKKLFIPYVRTELEESQCEKSVKSSIDDLQNNYSDQYIPQVNPREINLFYLTDEIRERIVRTPKGYETVDSKIEFSTASILEELETYPERFSPNVLMRPLYQEVLLPNLCYIGGGGEIAYWLQLKKFFQAQNVTFPILLLRNSAVLVSTKTAKKIEKLNLSKQDFFLKRTALINKKIRQISNIDLDLQPLKEKLQEQFTHLESLVNSTDASFAGTVAAQKQKQFNGIDTLEKRLLQAQKRKLVDHVERLSDLHETIFPRESLQERHNNFFQFYLEYGEDILPLLFESLDPLQLEFSWIELP